MKRKLRLLAAGIAALLPLLALISWLRATDLERGPLSAPQLPLEVGPWVAVSDEKWSDDILAQTGVDAYLLRTYQAPGRAPIWLYVGMYGALHGKHGKYHNPERCYPRTGWEILAYEPVSVELQDDTRLNAQLLKLEQEGHRRLVHYWFQPAGRWPFVRAAEELARVFDAVRGTPQYAFVRLSSVLPRGQEEATSRDLAEFAAAIAYPVRAAVDRIPRATVEPAALN